MEMSDLNKEERDLIDNIREDAKLSALIKTLTDNYYIEIEGELKITEYLDMMFSHMHELSETNLKENAVK